MAAAPLSLTLYRYTTMALAPIVPLALRQHRENHLSQGWQDNYWRKLANLG